MADETPLLDPTDAAQTGDENMRQEAADEEDTTPVPRWYKIVVLVVVLSVTATVLRFVSHTLRVATILVGFHAVFELVSALMFIVDPSKLHNGWMPDEGMPTYLAESGGINYGFWSALLFFKLGDPVVLWLNAAYCTVWVVYLSSHWLDMPWRAAVQLPDGSWAKVPIMIKGICGVASAVAAMQRTNK